MGHIELAAPVTHIWYFKGVPSRLGYLLDLAPKDLEKVIYFAAYMITEVDEDGRTEDLPNLQNEIDLEKQEIAKRRDADVDARAQVLEADLAELEAEGAKADARRKVRDSAEREMAQIRKRADAEIERLEQVWDRFKNLKVADLEGDELLYRELVDRYGNVLQGLDGRRGDPEAPGDLRPGGRGRVAARDHPQRQGPAQDPGAQAPQGGQRVPDHVELARGDGARRRPGHPAGPASDGPARRWPLRHLRPQRPVPPRDQPEQPPQAAARPRRAGDHRQQREADAPGGRRRAVRQRPPRASGHRPGQPAAEVDLRHAQGQAGPVPPEPARQARGLLGPFGHRRGSRSSSCTSAACPSRWRWSCSSRS